MKKAFLKLFILTTIILIYQNCGSAFNSFDSSHSDDFFSRGYGEGDAPLPDNPSFSFSQKLNFLFVPKTKLKLASGTVSPSGVRCYNPNEEITSFYPGKITRFELQNIIEDVLGLKDRINSENLTTQLIGNNQFAGPLTQSQSGDVFRAIETYPILNDENHFEEMNRLQIENGFLNVMINIAQNVSELFTESMQKGSNPILNKAGACRQLNAECSLYIEKFIVPLLWRKKLSEYDNHQIKFYLPSGEESEEIFIEKIFNTLKIVMASPQFFIKNVLPKKFEQNGPYDIFALDQIDLANRLSFYISSSAPDYPLYNDAIKGKLNSQSLIAHAQRLLTIDKNIWRFNQSFYGSWLKFNRSTTDTSRFESSDSSISSPKKFRFVIAHEALKETFNITSQNKSAAQLVNNAHKGLITSENFAMTTHSRPHETSLIKRGIFVYEKILCGELPDLTPADRTEIEEQEKLIPTNLSPIEKLALHRSKPRCAGCHDRIDPLAIGVESIDPFGYHRKSYSNGKQLVTRSVAGQVGYNNLTEFLQVVSHSLDYRACFVTQLSNKFQKNEDNYIKPCLMTSSMNGNSESGVKDMIVNIVGSPSFRFVKKPASESR